MADDGSNCPENRLSTVPQDCPQAPQKRARAPLLAEVQLCRFSLRHLQLRSLKGLCVHRTASQLPPPSPLYRTSMATPYLLGVFHLQESPPFFLIISCLIGDGLPNIRLASPGLSADHRGPPRSPTAPNGPATATKPATTAPTKTNQPQLQQHRGITRA